MHSERHRRIYIASNCPTIHKLSYSIQSEIKFMHHNNCSYITIVIINHKIYRNYHKDICVSIIAVNIERLFHLLKSVSILITKMQLNAG